MPADSKKVGIWVVAAMLASTATAAAQSLPATAPRDEVSINDAARQAQGRIAINQTSGHGNVQGNQLVIGSGVAADSAQHTAHRLHSRAASARIDGDALSHVQGALSINQSAGAGNAQLNLLMFGAGGTAAALSQRIALIDDAALAGVGANAPAPATGGPSVMREAVIGPAALLGSQGVVQINQSAGNGNASVNAIVLQLPGAAL